MHQSTQRSANNGDGHQFSSIVLRDISVMFANPFVNVKIEVYLTGPNVSYKVRLLFLKMSFIPCHIQKASSEAKNKTKHRHYRCKGFVLYFRLL